MCWQRPGEGKKKAKNIKRKNETHFAFTLIFAGYEMTSEDLFTLSYNRMRRSYMLCTSFQL